MGDAVNGELIFREHCAGCHRVDAAGGRLGPDLSRIGAARSREALVLRIRRGVEGRFSDGFAPVTLHTEDGQTVRGVTKNEDLFSVQIMDITERIQGFEKQTLEELEKPTQSAMPVFGPERLSDAEVDDLVRYLQTLRGFDPAVQEGGKPHAYRNSPWPVLVARALCRSRRALRPAGTTVAPGDGAGDSRGLDGRRIPVADLRRGTTPISGTAR